MKVERSLPASGRRGLSSHLQYETNKYRRRWELLGAKSTAGYLQSSSFYTGLFLSIMYKVHICFQEMLLSIISTLLFLLIAYTFFLGGKSCQAGIGLCVMMFKTVIAFYNLFKYTSPLLKEELVTHFWRIRFSFYACIFNNVLDPFHSALTLILCVRGIFADRAEYLTFCSVNFELNVRHYRRHKGIWQVLHDICYWHFKM